jgi:16S rRNA (uracil1498-N3)-methyltransferase
MASRLRRFLVSERLSKAVVPYSSSTPLHLDLVQSRHANQVLRLREGKQMIVIDPTGLEFLATIKGLDRRTGLVEYDLIEKLQKRREIALGEEIVHSPDLLSSLKPLLRVAQGIPQHGKMDKIIEKATELGIDEVIPLLTARTISRVDSVGEDRAEKIQARWERIARETIKQSRVSLPPRIAPPTSFKDLIRQSTSSPSSSSPNDLRVILFHPSEHSIAVKEFASDLLSWTSSSLHSGPSTTKEEKRRGRRKEVLLLIGPEGGFSEEEVGLAKRDLGEAKLSCVALGDSILKTDTAFVAAVSLVKFCTCS